MPVDSETIVALMDSKGQRWTDDKIATASHDIIRETSTDTRFLDAGQKLLGSELGAGLMGLARGQAYADDRTADGFYRTRAENDRGFAHTSERLSDSERRLDNRIYEAEKCAREGVESTKAMLHQLEVERLRQDNMRATMENMELKTKLYIQEALERQEREDRRGDRRGDSGWFGGFGGFRDFDGRGFRDRDDRDRGHNFEPRVNINIVDENLEEEEVRKPRRRRREEDHNG
jgi:hypothetical protein